MKKSLKKKIKSIVAGIAIMAAAFTVGMLYERYNSDVVDLEPTNGDNTDYIEIKKSDVKQQQQQAEPTIREQATEEAEEAEAMPQTSQPPVQPEISYPPKEYHKKEISGTNAAYAGAGDFDDMPNPTLNKHEVIDGLVNINYASFEVLVNIDGIGEKTAQKIIDYRREHGPFASIENIMDVAGIGEKKFEEIKDKICAVE